MYTLVYDAAPVPVFPVLRLKSPKLAGRDCPLCGEAGRPWGSRDGYPLRECCGILLSWQWPDEASYARLYTEGARYHWDQQRREGQIPYPARHEEALRAAEARLDLLRERAPRCASLIDVGCATGALVEAATARGILALGLEPNPEMAHYARERGRPVAIGGWETASGRWDVITLLDVLEHLTRPRFCLERLGSLLNPGGTLVVEWPEWGCPSARLHGSAWKHIRPLQHVCLYSDGAARTLFSSAGLSVRSADRPLSGTLGKITYYLSGRR